MAVSKGGNAGQGRLPLRLRLRGIQLGTPAAFEQCHGQVQGLLLIRRILPRHGEPVLGATQCKIVARHLRQQAHDHIPAVGFGGPDVGLARLNGAPHTPEEVQFPTRIESDVVQLDVAIGPRQRLGLTQPLARVRALGGYRRIAIEGRLREQGPGLAQPRRRHT
jgi:hypothetical protein